jgi:hypothetical protein
MGAAPSTPRFGAAGAPPSPGAAEQMFAALVGGKAYPISSEFWNQLLELPLTLQWPRDRVLQACHAFGESRARPPFSLSRDPRRPPAAWGRADRFPVLSRPVIMLSRALSLSLSLSLSPASVLCGFWSVGQCGSCGFSGRACRLALRWVHAFVVKR